MIHWKTFVGFLNDKEGNEAMAALHRLDVGRLKEVLAIFAPFIESAQRNSVCFSIVIEPNP
jgi:hypothetical protein